MFISTLSTLKFDLVEMSFYFATGCNLGQFAMELVLRYRKTLAGAPLGSSIYSGKISFCGVRSVWSFHQSFRPLGVAAGLALSRGERGARKRLDENGGIEQVGDTIFFDNLTLSRDY